MSHQQVKVKKKFLVDVGYGNAVQRQAIMAVLDAFSLPVKKYIAFKNQRAEVIDATKGKQVKSALAMLNGFLILSSKTCDDLVVSIDGD